MLNEGRQYIQTAPWLMIYPGAAIFIVVAIFNLWGDSLRDVLARMNQNPDRILSDPKVRATQLLDEAGWKDSDGGESIVT